VLHSLIATLCGPTIRARVWRGLTQEGALKRTLDEHHAMVDALAAGQSDIAHALAIVHIAGVEQWLRKVL
jgi:DNA-binding FadR family transcriptional regulator